MEKQLKEVPSPREVVDPYTEAASGKFTSAEFACYLLDARHMADGEMRIVFRIPVGQVLKALPVIKARQFLVKCQITKHNSTK